MPTAKGFTGQRQDGASGLDYNGARYYDPVLGQFASADTAADGLNRYGYVHGNPTTFSDPTGHRGTCPFMAGGGCTCTQDCGGGGGHGNGDGNGGSGNGNGGGGNGGGGGGKSDCHGTAEQCQAIDSTFLDSKMREVLYYLIGTSIGEAFLKFLLVVGYLIGGDRYIQWADLPGGEYGYTDSFGYIQLKKGLDVATAAATLIHEAVESLYAIVYGIRGQASQHMDYVAEWFAGEFESQKGGYDKTTTVPGVVDPYYGAYGLSFEAWRSSNDGANYSGEPVDQWELTHGGGEFPGWLITSSPDAPFVPIRFTYDPIGLSLDTLGTSLVPAGWCESGCAGA